MISIGILDGEERFFGFEHGLPLLMEWLALKVWGVPTIGSLDTVSDFIWMLILIMLTGSFLLLHFCVLGLILKCLT